MWLTTERLLEKGTQLSSSPLRRNPAIFAGSGLGPHRPHWRLAHSGSPLALPLCHWHLNPEWGKSRWEVGGRVALVSYVLFWAPSISSIKWEWGNLPQRPSGLQVGQFLPHRLPRGWLGPPCPLGGPSQAPPPASSPTSPTPSPGPRDERQAQPPLCSAGQPPPQLCPGGALRDQPASVEPEREPGGGSGRPAWEAGGGRQHGDRRDKPAAPRAAPPAPLGHKKPELKHPVLGGAGQGGKRGTHCGPTLLGPCPCCW